MSEFISNRAAERMMVAGSVSLLVGLVAAFDENARGRLNGVFTGEALNELTVASARVQQSVYAFGESVGFHGIDSTMSIFAIAALILFVVMIKL